MRRKSNFQERYRLRVCIYKKPCSLIVRPKRCVCILLKIIAAMVDHAYSWCARRSPKTRQLDNDSLPRRVLHESRLVSPLQTYSNNGKKLFMRQSFPGFHCITKNHVHLCLNMHTLLHAVKERQYTYLCLVYQVEAEFDAFSCSSKNFLLWNV